MKNIIDAILQYFRAEKRRIAEEKKILSEAWQPFSPHRLTVNQAKALLMFDDLQVQVLEVIDEEIRADLSNRALRADGIQRDKAMWAAVGCRMFLDAVKQKIEHLGERQKREETKQKVESQKTEKVATRTMIDLYSNSLINHE